MNDNLEPLLLLDENGEETEFEVITKLDIEENEYFLLSPMNEDEEVVRAMKVIKDENDEEILVPVESDFEIEMIEEAYATLFADEEE